MRRAGLGEPSDRLSEGWQARPEALCRRVGPNGSEISLHSDLRPARRVRSSAERTARHDVELVEQVANVGVQLSVIGEAERRAIFRHLAPAHDHHAFAARALDLDPFARHARGELAAATTPIVGPGVFGSRSRLGFSALGAHRRVTQLDSTLMSAPRCSFSVPHPHRSTAAKSLSASRRPPLACALS